MPETKNSRLLIGMAVLLLSALYLFYCKDRGWVSHDEGYIAHGAVSILEGGLPHVDYDEGYTGGLAFLHALAFEVWGERLSSVRNLLFLFALGMVAAVYALAVRVVPPAVAALVTFLCVVWTLPNYFASLPSWYNLFFALWGVLCVLVFSDAGRLRWLFVAGLMAGCSILCKQTGFYFVAAVLLFLAFKEQEEAAAEEGGRGGVTLFALFIWACCLALTLVLVGLLRAHLGAMEAVHFAMPGLSLCLALAVGVCRSRAAFHERFARLARMAAPFVLGVAIPLVAFLVPYMLKGAVGEFFVQTRRAVDQAVTLSYIPLPSAQTLWTAVPYGIVLVGSLTVLRRVGRGLTMVVACLLAAVVAFGSREGVYMAVWHSVRPIVPLVCMGGAAWLVGTASQAAERKEEREALFLLLAAAGFMSLIQYPMTFAIYFCYAAPILALAVVYLVATARPATGPVHICFLVAYLLFAVIWMNHSYIGYLGRKFFYIPQQSVLLPERANLRINAIHHGIYTNVVGVIDRQTDEDAAMYAGPDCSELYFLADRRSPTFGAYDRVDGETATERMVRIRSMIEDAGVQTVVVNHKPEFSDPLSPGLVAWMRTRYTNSLEAGYFEVRW